MMKKKKMMKMKKKKMMMMMQSHNPWMMSMNMTKIIIRCQTARSMTRITFAGATRACHAYRRTT